MNRRSLLTKTLTTTLGLSLLGQISQAQQPKPEQPLIPVEPDPPICPDPATPKITGLIQRNHGHEFFMTYEEFITEKLQIVSIQGNSGHPHTLLLTPDVYLALRTQLSVEIESTTEFGHKHLVKITRDPIV